MILLFFYLTFSTGQNNLSSLLSSHKWKADYVKFYRGEKISDIHSPPLSTSYAPPECGQIITFKNDHTCSVQYKGAGMWSVIDQYKWFIENDKKIKFINIGKGVTNEIILNIQIANQDSILLFSGPKIGIETGLKAFSVYKLKRI